MNNLPFPRTVSGWILALILILVSFYYYYMKWFTGTIDYYYSTGNYYQATDIKLEGNPDVLFSIYIPQDVSRFAARELTVEAKIRSEAEKAQDVRIFVKPKIDGVMMCQNNPASFVSCEVASNKLDFGSMQPGEQAIQTLWVLVTPYVAAREVTFEFYSSDDLKEKLPLDTGSTATIDDTRAFSLSFLRTILLPPWSNGFIPVLVLLIVYLFEHKIQPGQVTRPWVQKCWRYTWNQIGRKRFGRKVLSNMKSLTAKVGLNRHGIQGIASILVSYLYFEIGFFFLGLATNEVNIWWPLIRFGVSWLAISKLFESVDLEAGDPLYHHESINSDQHDSNPDTLEKITTTFTHLSEQSQQNTAQLVAKLDELIKICCDEQSDAKTGEQISSVLVEIKETLQQGRPELPGFSVSQELGPTMEKIGTLLEERLPAPIIHSPLDYPYDYQSLFKDTGLISLFKEELSKLSRQQFHSRMAQQQFALCIISLFASALIEDWKDELKVGETKLSLLLEEIDIWNDDVKTSLELWLPGSPSQYAVALMKWMIKFKSKDAENHLFGLIPQVCQPNDVFTLFDAYARINEENGMSDEIDWHRVLGYFVENDPSPDDQLKADALDVIWHPLGGSETLWDRVHAQRQFSVGEWKRIFEGLLKWLCVLPTEMAKELGKAVFDFYSEDKTLESGTQLAIFIAFCKKFPKDEYLDVINTEWCKTVKKAEIT